MEIIRKIHRMKEVAKRARNAGKTIGFVPTMGYLHEGHLSLIREARRMTDLCIVSIFVNPTQFGPHEDYERYPRDLERDAEILNKEKVDILFTPTAEDMYPPHFHTWVIVEKLSEKLCGKSRPGHFKGVSTVVLKLFQIVQPHFAYFGQKDAQQYVIIKRMVRDLHLDVELILMPIVRENDGLAMSSRNVYLNTDERQKATILYKALMKAQELVRSGERHAHTILKTMEDMIRSVEGVRIDYLAITDLEELDPVDVLEGKVLIAGAIYVGQTRLIDNIILTIPQSSKS